MSPKRLPYDYPPLTPILHQIVLRAPSGIDARSIADLVHVNYQTMMSELSGQPGHKCGVERLLPFMAVSGSDAPMHFLAREMGGVYLKLPAVGEGDLAPVQRQCLLAVKDFGQLMSATADALADGRLEPDERAQVTSRGHEAVTAIMGLLKLIEANHAS